LYLVGAEVVGQVVERGLLELLGFGVAAGPVAAGHLAALGLLQQAELVGLLGLDQLRRRLRDDGLRLGDRALPQRRLQHQTAFANCLALRFVSFGAFGM
jgi:hypothetical protein